MRIAVVGKYVNLRDAYLSVMEALNHGGIHHGAEVLIDWVASDDLGGDATEQALGGADGILIPGGFGIRGVEGKVDAVRFARERGVPFLGICLGLQCAVIEFARHVCGLEDANSSEFAPGTPDPVIDLLPEQKNVSDLGATMRLGRPGRATSSPARWPLAATGRRSSRNGIVIAGRSTPPTSTCSASTGW